MANSLLNGLKVATNYNRTENGSIAHKSTLSAIYDMYALGGAYRNRTDADCILLFENALEENEELAMKCLFYLRDVRGGGQGERRFFRVCMNWLAHKNPKAVKRNLEQFSEFGRWDDLYCLVGTPVEDDMFKMMYEQLGKDVESLKKKNQGVSLLGKWLKSCNASSKETTRLGNITREAFGLTHKQYRKILSALRTRINIVEKLMSENRWNEIEFDKIPSKAGLIYKNAFARRDMIAQKYAEFMKDIDTKVNAGTLYPYEVVKEVINHINYYSDNPIRMTDVERAVANKYWDNLTDYFNDATLNALAVVDTSGSMWGTPINVAISLGMYCAERAQGPFANHYISFASQPQLIKVEGVDFVDKVYRIYATNLVDNTNLEAVFDLLLDTAISNNVSQSEIPENIIIISDMQIDEARSSWYYHRTQTPVNTVMEIAREKWATAGYELPHLIYWNVDARQNTFLDDGENVSYVSGFSSSTFEQIMSGKTGVELMLEKLMSDRYSVIK